MPELTAISRDRHAARRWHRIPHYRFAAGEVVVPVVLEELPRAALCLPLALIRQGSGYQLVAVTGLRPGQNAFVTPEGKWLAPYVPAVLRGYPFRLAQTEDQRLMLCVDEGSGLVDTGPGGEAFFTEGGEVAPAVTEILEFLQQVEHNRGLTQQAIRVLAERELIQPWPLTLEAQAIEGLYQVDLSRFDSLDGQALETLQRSGALRLAHSQWLSMQHAPMLGQLVQARQQADAAMKTTAADTLNLDGIFGKNDDLLKFN